MFSPAGQAWLQGGRWSMNTGRCQRIAPAPFCAVTCKTRVKSLGISVTRVTPPTERNFNRITPPGTTQGKIWGGSCVAYTTDLLVTRFMLIPTHVHS